MEKLTLEIAMKYPNAEIREISFRSDYKSYQFANIKEFLELNYSYSKMDQWSPNRMKGVSDFTINIENCACYIWLG